MAKLSTDMLLSIANSTCSQLRFANSKVICLKFVNSTDIWLSIANFTLSWMSFAISTGRRHNKRLKNNISQSLKPDYFWCNVEVRELNKNQQNNHCHKHAHVHWNAFAISLLSCIGLWVILWHWPQLTCQSWLIPVSSRQELHVIVDGSKQTRMTHLTIG